MRTEFPLKRPQKDGGTPTIEICRAGKNNRGKVPVVTDATAPDVITRLRNVQPYTAGDDWERHPLQVLRTLNGEGKHRAPPIVVLTAGLAHFEFWNEDGSQHSFATNFGKRYEDGEQVDAFPHPGSPGDYIGHAASPPHHGTVAACVVIEGVEAFDGLTPLTVVDQLGGIASYVRENVLRSFFEIF
jgi:hypothetical protein